MGSHRRDSLLAEYQQCAQDVRATADRAWQVVYIFLSASVVALALVAVQVLEEPEDRHEWNMFFVILSVGVVASVFALGLILVNWRQRWVAQITYERMWDIERDLDLRKNLYVHALDEGVLDDWNERASKNPEFSELKEEDKVRLEAMKKRYWHPWVYNVWIMRAVALFSIAGWLMLLLNEARILCEWG